MHIAELSSGGSLWRAWLEAPVVGTNIDSCSCKRWEVHVSPGSDSGSDPSCIALEPNGENCRKDII